MFLSYCQDLFGKSFTERAFSSHFGVHSDVAELIWKYRTHFSHPFSERDLLWMLFYLKIYLPFEVIKLEFFKILIDV